MTSSIPEKLHLLKLFPESSIFWKPNYLEPSAWIEHIPFAFWIVENFKPSCLVELGVFNGTSYFSFCQAIRELNLNTRIYGVDTWQGDKHAGFYGNEVYERVFLYNQASYPSSSVLIRSTFDDARKYFTEKSIELLHIDGLHTYDAVKHDFESWLPSLAENAIVIFHDTNVRERDFGVYKFWEEICKKYKHFDFDSGFGLGIIALGDNYPDVLQSLFNHNKQSPYYTILKNFFSEKGMSIKYSFDYLFAVREKESFKRDLEKQAEVNRVLNSRIDAASEKLDLELEAHKKTVDEFNAQNNLLIKTNEELLYLKIRKKELQERLTQISDQAERDQNMARVVAKKNTRLGVNIEREKKKIQELLSLLQKRDCEVNDAKQIIAKNLLSIEQLEFGLELTKRQLVDVRNEQKENRVKDNIRNATEVIEKGSTNDIITEVTLHRSKNHFNNMPIPIFRRLDAQFSRLNFSIHKNVLRKFNLGKFPRHVPNKLIKDYVEVQQSGFFDRNWYLSVYKDVKKESSDPLLHFLCYGYKESKNPSMLFSTSQYLEYYPDVKAAGENALLHYLRYGKAEGRKIFTINNQEKNALLHTSSIMPVNVEYSEKDFLTRATSKKGARILTKIKTVAFVGQPEYFSFHYTGILEDLYNVKYFPNSFSGDPFFFRDLMDFNADLTIFFRGEIVPEQVLKSLTGVRVALSSEPFPKILDNTVVYTGDSLDRFELFLKIFDLPFDYIFHYDEISKAFFENQGIQLSGYFPFPIATEIIRPSNTEKKWDIFFSGRSTPHRDQFFGPLKRDFNFLHINHGVVGEDLLNFIHQSKISINIHAENEISWEPRTQFLMAAGSLLVSEPLSPTCPLRPGKDFIEVKNPWHTYETCRDIIKNFNEYKSIADNGQNRIKEVLSSRKNFPVFFNDLLQHKYGLATYNKNCLNLQPLKTSLKYNGFEHLLTELLLEHA